MKTFFALSVAGLIACHVQAQDRTLNRTEIELQKLIYDPALKHGSMAFMAVNLDNGTVIAEHEPFRSMVPASIQKLLTTAAALEQLGPAHRFKTVFGYTGTVSDGLLDGNLVVIGGGDPTLESRYFPASTLQPFADFAEKHDIQRVRGRLELDLSVFTTNTTPRGWVWEDIGNYFGASPTAVFWKDNLLEVSLRSGQAGSRAIMAGLSPQPQGLKLDIEVKAANSNRDDAWFFGAPGTDAMYATGSIPMHREKFVVKAANPQVCQSFAHALLARLKVPDTEVRLSHKVQEHQLTESTVVASPPLSEIVRVTNEKSVNLFAEALLLHLDTAEHLRSVEGGIAALEAFLKSRKVNTGGVRIADGSGLSPLNRTTCQTMIDVLTAMHRSKHAEVFRNSLPVAGQNGTLTGYFKGGKLEGNLRAKSGTMTGVRNYTGYVTNEQGQTVAFCLMLNDYDEDRKAELMKKIEEVLSSLTAQ